MLVSQKKVKKITMTMSIKRYSELIKLNSFHERLNYLKLNGRVNELTFNGHRYLNQELYKSYEWKSIRKKIIIRDHACDLGLEGYEIFGKILIHHLNPITIGDVMNRDPCVFDPENLVCVSFDTHNSIHYGIENKHFKEVTIRAKNDTCLWR